jgi:hypothetical protein
VSKTPTRPSIGFTKTQGELLALWRRMDDEQLLRAMRKVVEKTRSDQDQFAALPALLAALIRAARPTKREPDVTIDQLNQFLKHMHAHCNQGSANAPPMGVTPAIRLFAKKSGISQRTLERLWYESRHFQCLRSSVAGIAKFVRFASGNPPPQVITAIFPA